MILQAAATISTYYDPVLDCSIAAEEINLHFVTQANEVLQCTKLSLIVEIVDLIYTSTFGV